MYSNFGDIATDPLGHFLQLPNPVKKSVIKSLLLEKLNILLSNPFKQLQVFFGR
jgi:hypothetical protein